MFLKKLSLGNMDNNCYIIADENTKQAAVIDAPCDADSILKILLQNSLKLKYILLTHTHFDHIGALDKLLNKTGTNVAYFNSKPLIKNKMYNQINPPIKNADINLEDNLILNVGSIEIKVLHTPGHTPDSVCFLVNNLLFSGDTLFYSDIGRCDLPGGDYITILESIRSKIYTLDDEIIVYPGHGRQTTVGYEKQNNNYIRSGWHYEY